MLVLKKKEPKLGRDIDPLGNPSESVAKAHALLKRAVEKSVQVPSDVVAAVTDAHHSIARTGGFTDAELETRFWNAYGLLSSIRPVEEDRARYKRLFYWLLGVLLICQLYYLAGSLVSKRFGGCRGGVAKSAGGAASRCIEPSRGMGQAAPTRHRAGELCLGNKIAAARFQGIRGR